MKFKVSKISIFFFALFFSITLIAGGSGDETKKKGFDLNNLDRAVKPTEDFFKFAVGGWVKNNPIPDDQTRWATFTMLQEDNNKVLKQIVEEAASNKNWPRGSAKQKIGDFFAMGMDSARIEREGYKPILPYLNKIDAVQNNKELIKLIAEFHLMGIGNLFSFSIRDDAKKSWLNAPYLSQSGLGLPDVEYYTKDDARSKEIREKYIEHISNMFELTDVGGSDAEKCAASILALETELAKISNTRLENRNPEKTYNKMTFDNLLRISPEIDWKLYFESMGLEKLDLIIINQPKYITGISGLINSIPMREWKLYMKWCVLRDAANSLSSAFVNERFNFTGKFLTGAKVNQPRWKRVLGTVNGFMGELLGQIYVEQNFPPEAKVRAKKVVDNLLVTMGESIKGLEWMGAETKKQALKKLGTFQVKIGYPDKWKDYNQLEIARDSYFKNLTRAGIWAKKQNLEKIGKAVDRTEWGMSPQTVNAYYSPTRNEIVFPAGILQPPFFNQYADDALNYGAMGAVIGHEISHGFDDQGRKFDENGNIRDWWTKEDGEKFQTRAQKLVDQYNKFVVVDTFRVSGALTLGENIGDLGGLTISYAAFKNTEQYKKNEEIDGFTPSQRFFLGWAQVWATNARPEFLKTQVKTDVHSPAVQRVNGPLQNMPEFFNTFGVQPGDKMRNPDDKLVKIW